MRASMPDRGLYDFCFENPGSITYTIPSIVRDVSAIFVARITYEPIRLRK